jgi:hypothetical protein
MAASFWAFMHAFCVKKRKAEDVGSVTSFVNFFYFYGQFRFIPEHQVIKVPVRSIA